MTSIREWAKSQDPDWTDVYTIHDLFMATGGGGLSVDVHALLREVKRLKGNAEHMRELRKRQQERYAKMETQLAQTSARLAEVYAIVSKCVAPYEYTPAFKAKMYDHIVERLYPKGVAGNLRCQECGYREHDHPHARCTRGQMPSTTIVGTPRGCGGYWCPNECLGSPAGYGGLCKYHLRLPTIPDVECPRIPSCPVVGCLAATGGCYCDFDNAECRRRGHAAKQEWERAKDNT